MASRDWFTDCSTLFNRHSCKIVSVVGAALFAISLWYANRIEEQTLIMQASLQQIQIDVAVIRARQAPNVNGASLARAKAE